MKLPKSESKKQRSFILDKLQQSFFHSEKPGASFCSELIAKAYEDAGVSILAGRKAQTVTPAHFDREADELNDWEDVTQEYLWLIEDINGGKQCYRFAHELIDLSMKKRAFTNAS